MIKKMLLSILLAGSMIVSAAPVKVDNSSREAVMTTFLNAIAAGDRDAMWLVIPPELRRMSTGSGGEEKAKKTVWESLNNSISKDDADAIKQAMQNPATAKEIVKIMVQQYSAFIVQKDGKWYIDFAKIAAAETSKSEMEKLKSPAKMDHSSAEKLIEEFYLALIFDNIDVAWDAFETEARQKAFKGLSDVNAKKLFMAGFTGNLTPQMREQIKAVLAGPNKKVFVDSIVHQFRKALIFKDGKWYLDPAKMKR